MGTDNRSEWWRNLERNIQEIYKSPEKITLLLNGVDTRRARDFNGNTVLHYVTSDFSYGGSIVANHLINDLGCDVDAKNNFGDTPLKCALLNDNVSLADYLLKTNANHKDVFVEKIHEFFTYSFNIQITNSTKIFGNISLLKDNELNDGNDGSWSALHIAVASYSRSTFKKNNYNFRIVEQLIEKGADVNGETINGNTPLHYASALGRDNVVELLLSSGAKINAANNLNATPLMCAVACDELKTIEMLVEAGADVNIPNSKGRSCLCTAIKRRYYDNVELLLKNGAAVATKELCNPLRVFFVRNRYVWRFASQASPNKEYPTFDYWFEQDVKFVDLLLKFGARFDKNDSVDGIPIFSFIMKYGHKNIVRSLLRYGHQADFDLATILKYILQPVEGSTDNINEVIRHVVRTEAQKK